MNRFLLFTVAVLLPQVVNAEFVLIEEDIIHIGALGKSGGNYYLKACDNSIISIHNKNSLSFDIDAVCDDSQGNPSTDPILIPPTINTNSPFMAPALMASNGNTNSPFVPPPLDPPTRCRDGNSGLSLRSTPTFSAEPEPGCIEDYKTK